MKTGDKCTYITRAGNELPARVNAANQDGTVTVEVQRAADGVWLDLGSRDVVTEDEVIAARSVADSKQDKDEKDAALKDVRGKIHQKAKDKEKELKTK